MGRPERAASLALRACYESAAALHLSSPNSEHDLTPDSTAQSELRHVGLVCPVTSLREGNRAEDVNAA